MESFKELSISPAIAKAVEEMGYEKPSPIQAQTLPILLGEPTDFIGLAATGTGKTAAFSIPMLERVNPKSKVVQAIVLCPTRELALQVAGQIDLLGKHLGIKALPIYGGASYNDQLHGLRRGATVVVGTPGRVIDHIERGTLNLDNVTTIILDEADEMISMGFKDDLETILDATPRAEVSEDGEEEELESAKIWLFSATMSPEVRRVADAYLRNPKQVQVNSQKMLSGTVEQIYYATQESNKPEVLCKLIDAADDFFGLIFCQTKSLVTDLGLYLTERGYKVDSLHGDKDQNARERTMKAFRDRKVNILICTDVASRGLDVKDVTHVINYSIPRELDSYVHRIGRTARSGKTGFAMSLVTPSHRALIGRIEKMTKSKMVEGKIPNRKDIGMKKIAKVLEKFQDQKNHSRAIELMNDTWKEAIAAMTGEEIAARFLALTFPEVFSEKEKSVAPAVTPQRNINPRAFKSNYRERDSEDQSSSGRSFAPRARRFEDREPIMNPAPKGPVAPIVTPGGGFTEKPRFKKSFARPTSFSGERKFGERKIGGERKFGEKRSFGGAPRARSIGGVERASFGSRPTRADRPPTRKSRTF